MAQEDLSRLTIDKSKAAFRPGRKKKAFYLAIGLLAAVAAGLLYRMGFFTPPLQVQLANVTQVYPSQAFTVLTAFENVELPLLLTGLPRKERKERVALALRVVNLEPRMEHRPSQLSGGEQQRVAIARAIVTDPRLNLEAKRENRYYAEQSVVMSKFLKILGLSPTMIFSFGGMLGAMITMYSSVANRTSEIGTLRALGFQRGSILRAFLYESLFLGLIGGLIGVFLASFMQLITISTMNFQTFSELAFSFTLTWEIAWRAIVFSLVMGFVGGFLPSLRASRMVTL